MPLKVKRENFFCKIPSKTQQENIYFWKMPLKTERETVIILASFFKLVAYFHTLPREKYIIGAQYL